MGLASIDIDALEDLINHLQPVKDALAAARQKVVSADTRLSTVQWECDQEYLWSNMTGTTGGSGVESMASLPWVKVGRIEQIPGVRPYGEWMAEWQPVLRKTLSLAYDVYAALPGFGPHVPVVTIDEDGIDAQPLGYTPTEREQLGVDIGSKIANGEPLSDEDWVFLGRYGSDRNFVTGMYSEATVDQIGQLGGELAAGYGVDLAGFGFSDDVFPPGLSAEQKKQLEDLRAKYAGMLGALATSLATWANLPGNQDKVAQDILNVLQDCDVTNALAQTGLAIVLGYGSFNQNTALAVANGMYEWDLSHDVGDGCPPKLSPGLVDPLTGVPVWDSVQGGLRILVNSPGAATSFFTDSDVGDVEPVPKVKGQSVPVNKHVQWLVDRPWADDGVGASLALFSASVPQPSQQTTEGQAQVASQVMAYVSWRYQESKKGEYEFPPQPGLTQGIASIMAAYMADGIEIANSQGVHTDLGHGNPVGDGSFGLGLTSDMFGLAIQALSEADPSSSVILARGWSDHLAEYLGRRWSEQYGGKSQAEVDKSIQDFLRDPGGSSEAKWLQHAADGLDFISDNARWPYVNTGHNPFGNKILMAILSTAAGLAIGAISAGAGIAWTIGGLAVTILGDVLGPEDEGPGDKEIDDAVMSITGDAGDVWVAWLTSHGYFTPQSIAGWQGDPHYIDPFQSDGSNNSVITRNADGTYIMDITSSEGQNWLTESGFGQAGYNAVFATRLDAPLGSDTETTDKYNFDQPLNKQIKLP